MSLQRTVASLLSSPALAEAYVIWDDENKCVWCGFSLSGRCGLCHVALMPNNVSDDSHSLCSYGSNLMSKDD